MAVKMTRLSAPRTSEIFEFSGRNLADVRIAAQQFSSRKVREGRKLRSGVEAFYFGGPGCWIAQVRLDLA